MILINGADSGRCSEHPGAAGRTLDDTGGGGRFKS